MLEISINESLILIAVGTLVPLGAAAVSGLLVAVLQAATQVQEQTTAYLVRLVSVVLVCVFGGQWFFQRIISLFQMLLVSISQLGKAP